MKTTLDYNVSSLIIDENDYELLYQRSIQAYESLMVLEVKESRKFRILEIWQADDIKIKITIILKHLKEFIMALKYMHRITILYEKLTISEGGLLLTKQLPLQTEISTREKWKYTFSLYLDFENSFLILKSNKDIKYFEVDVPITALNELIEVCEEIWDLICYFERDELEFEKNDLENENGPHTYNNLANNSEKTAEVESKFNKKVQQKQKKLEVLEKPQKRLLIYEDQYLKFETVKGEDTFLRITERINHRQKDPILIPIECVKYCARVFNDIFEEMKSLEEENDNPYE